MKNTYKLIEVTPDSSREENIPFGKTLSLVAKSEFNFSTRRFVTFVFVLILLSVSYNISTTSSIYSTYNAIYHSNITSTMRTTEVKSQTNQSIGCQIPKLDPFDPNIKHLFTSNLSKLHCKVDKYGPIFELQYKNSFTLVRKEDPEKFNLSNCCYKLVSHKKTKYPDNSIQFSKECYSLEDKITKIPKDHELLAIHCTNDTNETEVMVDAFGLTPLKLNVEKRISSFYSKNKNISERDRINVVCFGIDAVSHMNFKRIMPKVHEYLVNNKSAISMSGYNRVGDNTYPNLMALLCGLTVNEANETCVKNKTYDDCPLIWKTFAEQGFRTSYGEDKPDIGTFNYIRKGFRKAPTDYYLRSLAKAADSNIKDNSYKDICYGPRLTIDFLLNYMKAMATTYKDKRYFQFIWTTALTHDYLNNGNVAEPILLAFLKWFEKHGHFNNTVLVLTSDHGLRWGEIRKTTQGKVEENMPFLYFMFPTWFKDKYKLAISNLKINSARLTTPFDVHELLQDIVHLEKITDPQIKKRTKKLEEQLKKNSLPRGISLFLKIPVERTCEMANIQDHYCVCHSTKNITKDSENAQQAANFAVHKLNSMFEDHPKCAFLDLKSIQNAQEVVTDDKGILRWSNTQQFQVAFTTSPGDATFDATIMKNSDNKLSMAGPISRTNIYGNQSRCVDDNDLKKYCFCLEND